MIQAVTNVIVDMLLFFYQSIIWCAKTVRGRRAYLNKEDTKKERERLKCKQIPTGKQKAFTFSLRKSAMSKRGILTKEPVTLIKDSNYHVD